MKAVPARPGQACTLSYQGGSVDCDQGMLEHYSPQLKEMLSADETCPCRKSVIILANFTVEPVCLALNLLEEAAGKEVILEYECLLPAGPVLSVLGINFTLGSNDIQVLASV
jgi:hypothetical protein